MKKPYKYADISKDSTVTVDITKYEMSLILIAYDEGLNSLDSVQLEELDQVINKLKYELWP